MENKKIKILIVDDSSVARELLAYIISSEATLEVVGKAENGEEAVEMTGRLHPDVILMDIVMPKMNGFEATKEIMARFPTPIIVVSGVFNKAEIAEAFEVMNAGAMTIIEKPKGVGDKQYLDTTRFVIETIKALSSFSLTAPKDQIKHVTAPIKTKMPTLEAPIKAVGIGASIGGPQALLHILARLPGGFPVPILVVQLMPKGFIEGFVKWLDAAIALNVVVPKNGEEALPGHVYIAPDLENMTLDKDGKISLEKANENLKIQFPMDILFNSLAQSYGANCIGILLKGIGSDGNRGIELMKQNGAMIIEEEPGAVLLPDVLNDAMNQGETEKMAPLGRISNTLKQVMRMDQPSKF